MKLEQEGRCAICGEEPRVLEVDHCHTKLFARALLCGRCNRTIGMANDNIDLLEACISYLKRFA